MKKLVLTMLAVALMALPAAASVQNIKVSGDVDSTWLVRDQFDLGAVGVVTNDKQFYQNLLVTQTRLRVDADLTDNVGATIAMINERAWGEDNETSNGNNDIDINLAYVTLREMLYSPLTVIIGRQNFAYGNSFVIDSAGTNNSVSVGGLKGVAEDLTKRTAQDAVRMVFDYSPLTIDIVASKVASNNLLGVGAQDDDVDLFGMNANWELGDDSGTVLESYFWAKIDQSVKSSGLPGLKADTVYMPGIRAAANLLDGLWVSGEFAYQFGTKTYGATGVNADRRAAGAQLIANYMVPLESTKSWSPVLTTAYTYNSGDSNPADLSDDYEAWDPMFENQSGGKIYNTLFNMTDCHVVKVRGAIVPMEDLTAAFEWNGLWLDKELADTDGNGLTALTLLQPDGTSIATATDTDKKLGDDLSFELVYDYTEDVKIGASYGWFFPGTAFTSDNDQVASQLMLNASVNF